MLKYESYMNLMAKTFRIITSTFETLLIRFMSFIALFVFEKLLVTLVGQNTVTGLVDKKNRFTHVPHVLYATSITVQQFDLLSGAMQERKVYLMGKQKLYGLKVETSVLPNGLAVIFFEAFLGAALCILVI